MIASWFGSLNGRFFSGLYATRRPTWLVLTVAVLAPGCAQTAAPPPLDPVVASRLLVLGTGALCSKDQECGEGRTYGACVLGTCFGLLTSESQPVRATLLERIAASRPPVQASIVQQLLQALNHPTSSMTTRIGAVQGLGVTLSRGDRCAAACEALRRAAKESEEPVAVHARLALSQRADLAALPGLLGDAREGTEHLRCSAIRALDAYLAAGLAKQVLPGLLPLLDDRAPGVRRAAAETLVGWRARPDVARALDKAAMRHPGDLRYIVESARLAAGEGS